MMMKTTDDPLERLQAAWDVLGSDEATRIVPRRRLWRGYATCYRRQLWWAVCGVLFVVLLMAALAVLAVVRTRDWLDVVPIVITGCLILYTLRGAVAAVAAVRRSAPFAAGRGSQSAMPRPMVPRSRMPQLAGATAVAAMLLVVTMPAYGGTVMRDYTASEREQIVEKIDDMMVISKL